MTSTAHPAPAPGPDPLFASYAQLARSTLGDASGVCLLDGHWDVRGQDGPLDPPAVIEWLKSIGWNEDRKRSAASRPQGSSEQLTAIPLERSDGTLLGVFCLLRSGQERTAPARYAHQVAVQLKPMLDCLHRELAAATPERSRLQVLTERTAELEWLFKVTSQLSGASDDGRVVRDLLAAATERLRCGLGVLMVPDKRLQIEHVGNPQGIEALRKACAHSQQHLLTWAQRQNRPLVINGPPPAAGRSGRCKILSVPVVRDNGRVIGALAFFNPPQAGDFESRHVFLARHLGRQTATVVESQFDLMTGLYTRGGLEQMVGRLEEGPDSLCGSVIYIDVDHMRVANELHGFELGNELIVRIAELFAPPLLPEGALAARLSGDRFALVLPAADSTAAGQLAEQLQRAAARIVIGPAQEIVEVSISCGVAALVAMPQGLARALAAAELACKTAKDRGRNRVELYACEDDSMMRRHEDVVAVGQLRAALKNDQLQLYAQAIVPLRDKALPGGYEILLRMRGADGTVSLPSGLIPAAQRYQLLPTVDRWVVRRTLQTLTQYRARLRSSGISVSINVSGQSLGDEDFIQQFIAQLKAAELPPGCITVEITEQAAVTNLVRANELIRQLKTLGCRFALDDFGTGTNSLAYLKSLQISRVKIDGSFVRDIVTDQRSQLTVRAIVELARGYGIDTVAEYVENEPIASAVRKLGVDYAQGYAYGKPEPLETALSRLGADESQRMRKLLLEL